MLFEFLKSMAIEKQRSLFLAYFGVLLKFRCRGDTHTHTQTLKIDSGSLWRKKGKKTEETKLQRHGLEERIGRNKKEE